MTASSMTSSPASPSLRDAVTHYHSSVLGHGLLVSHLDKRARRIERHLKPELAGG